jgi:hypothetical protein
MDKKRRIRALLMLFAGLFLATKLLGLHVFTHESDVSTTDQCEICHVVSADLQHSAQAEELAADFQPLPNFSLQKEVLFTYAFAHSDDALEYNLFSRPPPMI